MHEHMELLLSFFLVYIIVMVNSFSFDNADCIEKIAG